jgi:hypothetical protein
MKKLSYQIAMDFFDIILREEGLYHLKDDMVELRKEILKRLDLLDLKDSPDKLMEAMQKLLDTQKNKLESTRKEVGEIIMSASGRKN